MGTDDIFKKKKKQAEQARQYQIRSVRPPSYLIVTEGEKTEKNYFDGLKNHIMSQRTGTAGSTQPSLEIKEVGRGTGVLVSQAEKIVNRSSHSFDEVWIVCDKDDFTDFDEAIHQAEDNGFHVAWSNPCFEYWLYLHFSFSSACLPSREWGKRLSVFLPKDRRGKAQYSKNIPKIFALATKDSGLKNAVFNAVRQRETFDSSNKPSQLVPCTTVDKLIKKLADYLGDLLD